MLGRYGRFGNAQKSNNGTDEVIAETNYDVFWLSDMPVTIGEGSKAGVDTK